jgi:hypothetical protein
LFNGPLHNPEQQELQMSHEIPVLLDPSLKLDSADLKAAWDADPEAKQPGRIEKRPPTQQFPTGFEELMIAVAAGLIVAAAEDPVKEAVKKAVEVMKRLLATKAKAPVTVEQQTLPGGQDAVVVQKK